MTKVAPRTGFRACGSFRTCSSAKYAGEWAARMGWLAGAPEHHQAPSRHSHEGSQGQQLRTPRRIFMACSVGGHCSLRPSLKNARELSCGTGSKVNGEVEERVSLCSQTGARDRDARGEGLVFGLHHRIIEGPCPSPNRLMPRPCSAWTDPKPSLRLFVEERKHGKHVRVCGAGPRTIVLSFSYQQPKAFVHHAVAAGGAHGAVPQAGRPLPRLRRLRAASAWIVGRPW
mmetsp:Transcript_10135/g.33244  ORF Transcript_10135/g.33244 Transcript_10135/m.33244 type:complete len:229 (+) Transcript_10135:1465-2151(+)